MSRLMISNPVSNVNNQAYFNFNTENFENVATLPKLATIGPFGTEIVVPLLRKTLVLLLHVF